VGSGIIAGGVAVVKGADASTTQRLTPRTAFVREPAWVGPSVVSTAKPAFFVPLAFSF
jgi:hypothetical protein